MKIVKSGASLSKIVQIGEKLKILSEASGREYLPLNRGVNAVVNIDLAEVVKHINFNAPEIQVYPPGPGMPKLRQAINEEYFCGRSSAGNILITAGGMNALDQVIQCLDIEKLFLPSYYWGCYFHLLTIRGVRNAEYSAQADLENMIDELRGNAVLICDPGNPLGEKYDDEKQFALIEKLNDAGVIVLFDSPYRRIFFNSDDDYYSKLAGLENVIITESFSKSVGLSGQRLGFVHTTDSALRDEVEIRLMYNTNGVNAFAQVLVHALLTTDVGRRAAADFKARTAAGIEHNIRYLEERGLLAGEFYHESRPKGIFVIVDKTERELLENRIGSVSLSFFTKSRKDFASRYSRICVSVAPERFREFFDQVE